MAKLFAWETDLPRPNLEACGRAMKLGPGRAAVEMAALETTRGGLYLPDKERKNRRPAIGVLLAIGAEVGVIIPEEGKQSDDWEIRFDHLDPGEVVFVRPGDGKRIQGFGIEGYDAENEVRLLGCMALYKGLVRRVPLDESIFGAWNPMTRTARAYGTRLLLQLPEKAEASAGGIFLPQDVRSRTDVAKVLSAGARVQNYAAGDIVCFERRALHEIHTENGVTLAFIHEDGIYMKLEEPEPLPA